MIEILVCLILLETQSWSFPATTQEKIARGGDHPHIHRTAPFGVILRSVRLILGWWIAGRGTPSPFFDEKTKEPRALPHVLSAAEREALNTVA